MVESLIEKQRELHELITMGVPSPKDLAKGMKLSLSGVFPCPFC